MEIGKETEKGRKGEGEKERSISQVGGLYGVVLNSTVVKDFEAKSPTGPALRKYKFRA